MTPLAYAGGGPLGLESFVLKPFEQTKTFIVAARLYVDNCDNIQVIAHLENQTDGDSITTFSPPDDGTYYEPHYFTGAPKNSWDKICIRYFQVKSSQEKLRTVTAQALINGEPVKADTQLAFGNDEYSKQVQNFDRYNNMPQVDIVSEKLVGAGKREVMVQWNKIPNASSYVIFVKPTSEPEGSSLLSINVENVNQKTITLDPEKSYFIGVNVCSDDCTKEASNTYEIYLQNLTGTGDQTTTIQTPPNVYPTIIPGTQNDKKLKELNKKVADLEGKLDKSEKKQNLLEEKINQLFAFIRSLFPSFK